MPSCRPLVLFASWLLMLMALPEHAVAQGPGREIDPLVRLQRMEAGPAVPRGVAISVAHADGKPAAGAVVVVMPSLSREQRAVSDSLRLRFPDDPLRALAATAAAFGVRYSVDTEGRTTAPAGEGITVLAFTDGATALQVFRPERPATRAAALQLVLRPPLRIAVEVLRSDGTPAAGVPVGPVVRRRAGRWVWTTGSDGIANVVLPELGTETAAERIALLVGTRDPLEAAIVATGEPIRFRLPATGTVRVRLADGAALRGEARFVLTAAQGGTGRIVPPTEVEPRAATFAWVEPGASLIAQVTQTGADEPLTAVVTPLRAGETVEVLIDPVAGLPRIAMQLRDPEGKPVALRAVVLDWQRPSNSYQNTIETDAEGRAEFKVEREYAAEGTLTLRLPRARGRTDELVGTVEVPLGELKPGVNDRGAVQFVAAPIVLAGTVVDKGGKPAAGALLSTSDPRGAMQTAEVGADGRFTLRAIGDLPEEVRLACSGGDWFLVDGAQVALPRGKQDVRLVAQQAARLLVGLPDLPADVRVDLRVECEGSGEAGAMFSTDLRADTRELKVPPGTWNLVFRLGNDGDEVCRIERVIADAGVENHDPRLMKFDWRQFLRLVTVRVEGPDGQPTDEAAVWQSLKIRNGTRTFIVSTRGGSARLLVPKDGSRVVVRSRNPAWRERDLGVVDADVVARLQAATRVSVQISAMPKLPEGCVLQAMLAAEGKTTEPANVTFDADGRCVLLAPSTGRFRLQLMVRRGNVSNTVDGEGRAAIDVGDRDQEHRFESTPALQRAIEAAVPRQ